MTPFHEILCGFYTEYAYKNSRSKLPVLYARMLFSVVFLIKKIPEQNSHSVQGFLTCVCA